MKTSDHILPIVLAVLMSFLSVEAQSSAWDRYRESYDSLVDSGRFDEALKLASNALEELVAERGRDNTRVAVLILKMGIVNLGKSDFAGAEKVLSEGVEIFEEILSPNHALVIESQWWLAEAYYGQEKYDLAISLLKKTLQAAETTSGQPKMMSRGVGFSGTQLGDKIFGPSGEWVTRITERIDQCLQLVKPPETS